MTSGRVVDPNDTSRILLLDEISRRGATHANSGRAVPPFGRRETIVADSRARSGTPGRSGVRLV